MTLAEVKQYLRVDGSEEDALIQMMMAAAEDFVIGAVGAYDESQPKAKMLYLAAMQDMYDDQRILGVSTKRQFGSVLPMRREERRLVHIAKQFERIR